jgi:hypothetical protein
MRPKAKIKEAKAPPAHVLEQTAPDLGFSRAISCFDSKTRVLARPGPDSDRRSGHLWLGNSKSHQEPKKVGSAWWCHFTLS